MPLAIAEQANVLQTSTLSTAGSADWCTISMPNTLAPYIQIVRAAQGAIPRIPGYGLRCGSGWIRAWRG